MYKRIIGISILALTFGACSKTPLACIRVVSPNLATDSINVGETVSLTSCSENAKEFRWDYGNSKMGSFYNTASTTYDSAGVYTISLLVINGNKTNYREQEITVYP
jgi:PKD repeat protein